MHPDKPIASPAQWTLFRPDGLGFEIALPGEPQVETAVNNDPSDEWTRRVSAHAMFNDDVFGVSFLELKSAAPPLKMYFSADELLAQFPGAILERETELTLDGFPALEVVMASTSIHITRLVAVGNAVITAVVVSGSVVDEKLAQRFFGSLKILAP